MDYEQKYKNLVERLMKAKEDYDIADERYCCVIDGLIPEPQEEDERIRKEIISYIKSSGAVTNPNWIAWLEKQGDKAFSVERVFAEAGIKPAYKDGNSWCVLIGKNIQEGICGFGETPKDAYVNFLKELWNRAFQTPVRLKPEYKPKFKVGDFVLHGKKNIIFQVEKTFLDKTYRIVPVNADMGKAVTSATEDTLCLWTIQDAKDGDVLSFNDGHGNDSIELIKSITEKKIEFWFCLTNGNRYEVFDGITPYTNLVSREDATPATKEQRDLLFQKMKEAGYEWDAEKKDLRKIEQKPTWSEEDENRLKVVISFVNSNPAEDPFYDKGCLKDWLKSLKERYTWKPSDEQIKAIKHVAEQNRASEIGNILDNLLVEIKTL